MVEIERLLMKCRSMANGITDSDDEEDYVFPSLVGYDFHAIYKKDGLQFDENWQVNHVYIAVWSQSDVRSLLLCGIALKQDPSQYMIMA